MIQPDQVFATIQPLSQPSGNGEINWTVEPSLPYFNGHFPQSPILPAVAIVDASVYLLQRVLDNAKWILLGVNNAKFQSPILPNQKVKISWCRTAGAEWLVEWKAEDGRLLAMLDLHLEL